MNVNPFVRICSISLSEISRYCTPAEMTKTILNRLLTLLIFRMIAPSSTVLFKNIHFKLFGFVISQYNFIGVFLLVTTFLYVAIAFQVMKSSNAGSQVRIL